MMDMDQWYRTLLIGTAIFFVIAVIFDVFTYKPGKFSDANGNPVSYDFSEVHRKLAK